jgi:hypothetical protein
MYVSAVINPIIYVRMAMCIPIASVEIKMAKAAVKMMLILATRVNSTTRWY